MNTMERVGSVLGGGALVALGLRRRSAGGAALSAVGAGLLARGVTGAGPALTAPRGVRAERAFAVQRPPGEVYEMWRQAPPTVVGELMREAAVVEDRPGVRLAWRTGEGEGTDCSGSATFRRLPADRGTEVRVVLHCVPGVGALGLALATLWGRSPGQRLAEDLRAFKQRAEAGEVPTVAGQPMGAGQ